MGTIRGALKDLDYDMAARDITFKSWREGRATELARTGHSFGEIMKAEEWQGASSCFRFADVDEIDPNLDEAKLLDQRLEQSEKSDK